MVDVGFSETNSSAVITTTTTTTTTSDNYIKLFVKIIPFKAAVFLDSEQPMSSEIVVLTAEL